MNEGELLLNLLLLPHLIASTGEQSLLKLIAAFGLLDVVAVIFRLLEDEMCARSHSLPKRTVCKC